MAACTPKAGLIVRQMRDQGLKTAASFSGDGITTDEFCHDRRPGRGRHADDLPAGSAQEAPGSGWKSSRSSPPKNFKPEAYTLYSYAAVQIMAEAIAKRANSVDPKKIAEALHWRPWTVKHRHRRAIGFDKKGDITRPDYVMYIWKDGKYIEMDQPS